MAARLVQNISDDYLSCSICLNRYDEPRKLPCEHTFCTSCLRKHIESTSVHKSELVVFTCPLCRTEISQPIRNADAGNWVNSFPCDKLIHDLVSTLSNHERNLSPLQNKCKVHTQNELNLFCMLHLALICSKCVDVSHRDSDCRILPVDEAIIALKPRIEEIRKRFCQQVSALQHLSQVDSEFNHQKFIALAEIQNLEERLDRFRVRCYQQLAIQKSDIEKLNKEHIEERKTFYALAARLLESQCKLESFCEVSDKTGILSELNSLTKRVDENEGILNELSHASEEGKLRFTINKDLDRFLNSFSALGFVDKTSSRSVLDSIKTGIDGIGLPSSLKGILNRKLKPYRMSEVNATFTSKLVFPAKLPNEGKCWIIKIIPLPDSTICALDKENAKLKRFDSQGKLINNLSLVDVPYSMALLKPVNEIVITKADKDLLEFVGTTSDKLEVKKYVPTRKKYVGVCQVSEDIMAVSTWSQACVDIIDRNGFILTSINEDFNIFEIPDMLCCNSNSEIIVVNKGHELICVDTTGQIKWKTISDNVIHNITSCEDGSVYICCKDAEKVFRVDCSSSKNISLKTLNINGRKALDIGFWNSQIFLCLQSGNIEIMQCT